LAPDPSDGAYSPPPDHLSEFKETYREGKGRGRERKGGDRRGREGMGREREGKCRVSTATFE